MARNSSKQIMGYLKIDKKHHAAMPGCELVVLDVDAWTRLITGGLAQGVINLPQAL